VANAIIDAEWRLEAAEAASRHGDWNTVLRDLDLAAALLGDARATALREQGPC
jgi:hypothetical protein